MLFAKDKFSQDGPKWEKLNPQSLISSKNLINLIEANYHNFVGRVINIYKVKGLEVNSSNFLIEGSLGKIILKVISKDAYLQLKSQDVIYNSIDKFNIPIPGMLGSADKNIDFDDAHIAIEYIKGRYFSGSSSDLSMAASAINELHNGIQNFKLINFSELPLFGSHSNDLLNRFIKTEHRWEALFDRETRILLTKHISLISAAEKYCVDNLSKLEEINKSIFHIDLHPQNILIGSIKATIIDVDSIQVSRWPIAIGFAFCKLARQALTNDSLSDNDLRHFLNELTSSYINENNQSDIDLLFLGALSEVTRRLFTILEGNLDNKISPWNGVLGIQINVILEILFLAKHFSVDMMNLPKG